MGCWNKTCGLSQLHIECGDPVYVFLMEKSTFKERCYSSHLWKPILLPFYSEYNDYGSGENSSGAGLEFLLDALKKELVEKEVGENKYHDIAVKKEGFDEEMLFSAMQESRLFIPNHYAKYSGQPEEVPVEFVMMRKDIVDEILESYKVEGWENGETVLIGLSEALSGIEDLMEVIKDYPDYCESFQGSIIKSRLREKRSILQYFPFLWGSLGDSYFLDIPRCAQKLLKEGETEMARSLLVDALKGCLIAVFMERTRHSWIPQCGEGSQNTELEGHKLLAKTVLGFVEKEEERITKMQEEEEKLWELRS